MRLQENNLIMEQYALINEKKKLPKGFVPFKKGHGKKKGKEDDKDSKSKKKNPFASLKKESAAIYATMSENYRSSDRLRNDTILRSLRKNGIEATTETVDRLTTQAIDMNLDGEEIEEYISSGSYATKNEAPMTADDQQLRKDADITTDEIQRPKPSAEEIELLNSVAPTIGMDIENLWSYYLDCKDERAADERNAGDPPTNETLADFLQSQNDMGVFDDMRRDHASHNENIE